MGTRGRGEARSGTGEMRNKEPFSAWNECNKIQFPGNQTSFALRGTASEHRQTSFCLCGLFTVGT